MDRFPFGAAWAVLLELFHGYEQLLLKRGLFALLGALVGVLVGWFVYTPVHELLHVLACWMTGGEVRELQIKPLYGGHLWAALFPFVTAGGQYAGRLTDFDVPNDAAYFVVDLFPYVLSLFALALARWAVHQGRSWAFGAALVPALVPLWSVVGDFFEAVSLVLQHVAMAMSDQLPARAFIADDAFRLWRELGELGLANGRFGALIAINLLLATLLALFFVAGQRPLANRLFPHPIKPLDITTAELQTHATDARTKE